MLERRLEVLGEQLMLARLLEQVAEGGLGRGQVGRQAQGAKIVLGCAAEVSEPLLADDPGGP